MESVITLSEAKWQGVTMPRDGEVKVTLETAEGVATISMAVADMVSLHSAMTANIYEMTSPGFLRSIPVAKVGGNTSLAG